MEYGNAARFLKSYNRIESQLKYLYGERAAVNFTDLVRRCTDRNLTVRRYENELVDYGKLRNAIVHRTAGGELFIANPCDDVVANIEYIEKQICNPPRVTAAIRPRKIASVFADKPLLTAVQAFADQRQKNLLVYDRGKLAGVFNSYMLCAAIAERAAAGEDVTQFLMTTPCSALLGETLPDEYLLLPETATVFDVFEAFERKKGLFGVIVTANGAVGEKALLLVTPSDFPAINRYLESSNTKSF